MAQIKWSFDELVLAADLISRNSWSGVRQTDPRAIELSEILRRGQLHAGAELPPKFRSPGSIQRKTYDLVTADEAYEGKPTKGTSADADMIARFRADTEGMQSQAQSIRSALLAGQSIPEAESIEMTAADEGGLIEYVMRKRERDPKLRAAKLRQAISRGMAIACEVCSFNFAEIYGARGDGYIEVHHVTPLYVSGKTTTSLDDLALLCSNCHRMCHRSPLVRPTELQASMSQP